MENKAPEETSAPGTRPPVLSVVFSFRNEEEVLPELLRRLHDTLRPLDIGYEFIFVNDASTDNSLAILTERAKTDESIKIVTTSRRFGQPPCLMAGLRYSRGAAVVYMDADLQDPPEVIPKLIEEWKKGAEIVYTVRISREGEPWIKLWLTKWAYKAIRYFSEIDLPVEAGEYRLLSRRVVAEMGKFPEKSPYFRGLVNWVGFKKTAVAYRRERRFAGETHFPLLGLEPAKAFLYACISYSQKPLFFSLIFGIALLSGAAVYFASLALMAVSGMNVPGWSILFFAVIFLGGTLHFSIGILGLYLKGIYEETKNRPNFIVESTIGFEKK